VVRALRRAGLTAALALALPSTAAASARPFPRFGAGCARADFTSAGTHVRAERCGRTSGTAVVVLHGCGGFDTFDHSLAADLPALGIATLDVDYFAPTPPPGSRGFCSVWTRPQQLFARWERVTADAARALRRRGYAHVGAVGWSLGAGVALATAEDTGLFGAVAAFSALASPATVDRARALPPSIFLDGGPRDIVPPANARALYAAARRAGVRAALFVYPDGTHEWAGRQGAVGRARAAAFLRGVLR
jgi:dienelactone hydrolase